MSAMLLLNLVPYSSYIAVLPLAKEEWGLSSAQAGAVYSAYLAGYALASLYVVPLPDRWGCRRVILGSMLVSVIGNMLFPLLAHGFVSALALRLLPGIGMVGVYMPGLRLIAERFPQRGRGAAMGMFTSCAYGANSLSLALTGSLIPSLGWRDAYLLVSAISAVSLGVGYLALRRGDDRFAVGSPRLRLSVTLAHTPEDLERMEALHLRLQKEAIDLLRKKGIVEGNPDGKFRPAKEEGKRA
ncbi:MAG: MFS transporter, partial [Chloroflexota bacterium]